MSQATLLKHKAFVEEKTSEALPLRLEKFTTLFAEDWVHIDKFPNVGRILDPKGPPILSIYAPNAWVLHEIEVRNLPFAKVKVLYGFLTDRKQGLLPSSIEFATIVSSPVAKEVSDITDLLHKDRKRKAQEEKDPLEMRLAEEKELLKAFEKSMDSVWDDAKKLHAGQHWSVVPMGGKSIVYFQSECNGDAVRRAQRPFSYKRLFEKGNHDRILSHLGLLAQIVTGTGHASPTSSPLGSCDTPPTAERLARYSVLKLGSPLDSSDTLPSLLVLQSKPHKPARIDPIAEPRPMPGFFETPSFWLFIPNEGRQAFATLAKTLQAKFKSEWAFFDDPDKASQKNPTGFAKAIGEIVELLVPVLAAVVATAEVLLEPQITKAEFPAEEDLVRVELDLHKVKCCPDDFLDQMRFLRRWDFTKTLYPEVAALSKLLAETIAWLRPAVKPMAEGAWSSLLPESKRPRQDFLKKLDEDFAPVINRVVLQVPVLNSAMLEWIGKVKKNELRNALRELARTVRQQKPIEN